MNIQINQVALGTLLKEYREENKLSQRDIASSLGYANANFISMLETGKTNIPVKRLNDVIEAYQMDSEFITVFVQKLMPDMWELFMQIYDSFLAPNQFKNSKAVQKALGKMYKDKMKEKKLESFLQLDGI